jgi:5-formyltetrahydrofolate cyclo-ligase
MEKERFWQLIEEAREAADGDPYQQAQRLTEALAELPADEIVEFDDFAHDLQDQAYTAALWEACYIIEPGCSEDQFLAWRQWLIGQGQQVFERALAEPDTLADVVPEEHEGAFELLLGVADDAYEQVTGEGLPFSVRPTPPLRGELHENDADIFKRFPRLTAKFVDEAKD